MADTDAAPRADGRPSALGRAGCSLPYTMQHYNVIQGGQSGMEKNWME